MIVNKPDPKTDYLELDMRMGTLYSVIPFLYDTRGNVVKKKILAKTLEGIRLIVQGNVNKLRQEFPNHYIRLAHNSWKVVPKGSSIFRLFTEHLERLKEENRPYPLVQLSFDHLQK
ncbi:MAG: hypothetical protein S4CHLAM20_03710 [Chlamydiia bacterium]|nr:hypothetical protein [Chlamydiia bacterium]